MLGLFLPVILGHNAAMATTQDKSRGNITQQIQAIQALAQFDRRLYTIGYDLRRANVMWCQETIWSTGIMWTDLRHYDQEDAAQKALNINHRIAILTIAPNSPAAQAGLLPGDDLIAINDENIKTFSSYNIRPKKKEDNAIFSLTDEIILKTSHSLRIRGQVNLHIDRHGQLLTFSLGGTELCPSQIIVKPVKKFQASADGDRVWMSVGILDYAQSDTAIAALLAHELAHNLLAHRERLDHYNVKRGFFGLFGKSQKLIRATELESDRLSIWLLANAGYNLDSALHFWAKLLRKTDLGILGASTHYKRKKRLAYFQEEIRFVNATNCRSQRLCPPPLLTPERPIKITIE